MKELQIIQSRLKAPKGQYNQFGKYNYRSCEDILEAVKPLLEEQKCTLTLTDDIVMVGDRIYVKATATIKTIDGGSQCSVTAFAREEAEKKGMDSSQVTGAASSYARKYALNGLFCIDDVKDSDVTNMGDKKGNTAATTAAPANTGTLAKQKEDEWIAKVKGVQNRDELMQVYKDAPDAIKQKGSRFYAACEKKGGEL